MCTYRENLVKIGPVGYILRKLVFKGTVKEKKKKIMMMMKESNIGRT